MVIKAMTHEGLEGLITSFKKGMRIFKRGLKKAVAMLEKGEEKGVFVWAPSLKKWLKDPDYISWLGTNLFFQTLGKFNQNASRKEKLYQKSNKNKYG